MTEQPVQTNANRPDANRPDADRPDYGLVDDAANDAVHAVVADVTAQLAAGEVSRQEAVVLLADGMREAVQSYPDVLDATTRTRVVQAMDPVMDGAGEERLTPWEW